MHKFTVSLLSVLATILINSCGGETGDCSNSLAIGTWASNSTNERITFGASCSFTSDVCVSTGVIPSIVDKSGTAIVTIDSTAGLNGCLTVGNHSCVYVINEDVSPDSLSFSCDGRNPVVYFKE